MSKQSPKNEEKTTNRRIKGVVVKRSGIKTVAVEVVREFRHPVYGKAIKQTKKYLAHDPLDSTNVGDEVMIEEARPMSRKKRFIVVNKAAK